MKPQLISFVIIVLIFLIDGCTPKESAEKRIKIAVLLYSHETCTFCPGGDTDVADWTKIRPVLKGNKVLEAGSYIRGFVNRAMKYDNINLVGLTSPYSVFGGSSRSWNTEESFEHFMGLMMDDLKANMPVQGVYLALHGALAVRNIPRPEAEIARRVREIVGEDIPIVGTFDLHGNEDEEFLKWANGAFVTKRFPHYDSYLQGERAAQFMKEIIDGAYISTTATRKPPVITATVLQWTGKSPAMDIMERARRWEARQRDTYVSVFYGYPWSDVPDVGTTVHVMTNNNQELADEIADDMNEFIWRVREEFTGGEYPMPDKAVIKTKQAITEGAVPVVLGDYSDRPGDATWILRELIDNQVNGVIYAALRDERALDSMLAKGSKPGDDFDMEVGGFTGPQAGDPVRITGKVKYFGPQWSYDNIAVIEYGESNLLIITPTYEQIITPDRLRFENINPDDFDVFVVKSRAHFRRGFDETGYAKTILVVDAPGPWIGTTRLNALDYKFAPIDKLYPYGTPEMDND